MKVLKKLKAAHFYQYVRFQNKNENFVTKKAGMEDLELELLEGNVVSVKTSKDHILVFSTNTAYIIPEEEANKDIKIANRGPLLEVDATTPKKR